MYNLNNADFLHSLCDIYNENLSQELIRVLFRLFAILKERRHKIFYDL